MEFEVTGVIEKVTDIQKGTSKEGKDWQKLTFTVKTNAEYNNLYAFDVFGIEKVDNFTKFNKEGQTVTVKFNIRTNPWQEKFFTSLEAWRIEGATEGVATVSTTEAVNDDLPF